MKLGKPTLVSTIINFIEIHATNPPHGLGEMIYQKALGLIKCVDTCEFMGGGDGSYDSVRKDPADIRLGCQQKNIGFSIKTSTESQVEIKSLRLVGITHLLGGEYWKKAYSKINTAINNPLMEAEEKKKVILETLYKLAYLRFHNKPKGFVKLLQWLITSGANTLPAAKNLLRNRASVGWSGAFQKDFTTNDDKLGAKKEAQVKVGVNNTYLYINYKVEGNKNRDGTTLKFEPTSDLSAIQISANRPKFRG